MSSSLNQVYTVCGRGFENISADSQIDNIVTDALRAKLHLSLTPGSGGFLGTKI